MAIRMRLPLQLCKNFPPFRNQKLVHTEAAANEPAYPPILPSLTAKSKSALLRNIKESVESICASPVDKKIRYITKKQWRKFIVYPQTFAFNADKWHQHFTKTAYIPGLPDKFTAADPQSSPSSVPEIDDAAFKDIRDLIARLILHEHWHKVQKRKPFTYKSQETLVGPFLRNLVSELTYTLCKYNPQLQLSSLDINPQVSFYWRRGKRIIPKGHRKGSHEPTRFQIDDRPLVQIRIPQQLPQFTPMESSYTAEVVDYPYDPNLMPLFRRQYINHIFTGAKVQDPACYGHTQFHLVPDKYHRDRLIRRNMSEQVFLRANAVASLFAWTGAQAMYQGFWNFEDVTRPFVSQAVISDGHFFSFFCYQLNTVALSVETDANNPRNNLLWGIESLRLYEDVQDGEVVGLNDDVIKLLVQFLLNRPEN